MGSVTGEVFEEKEKDSKKQIPNFRKRVFVQKEISDLESEKRFNEVKPDDKKMSKDLTIFKRMNMQKRLINILVSISAFIVILILVLFSYFAIKNGEVQPRGEQTLSDSNENNIQITRTPQKNIMHQIAEQNNPTFQELVSDSTKIVFATENTIVNNENNMGLTVDGYTLVNTNHCTMSKDTDFCFVSEVNVGDETVGMVYAFENMYQNQFFNNYENPEQIHVDGFSYAATANVVIAGEEKNAVLMAQDDGLGFGFVVNDSNEKDKIVKAIKYENRG